MDAPALSVLTAAPVSLVVGNEKREFSPLGITVIGRWLEKLSEQRCKKLPPMTELLVSLKGHDSEVVTSAIRAFYDLHQQASDPSLDELMEWLTSNPINIASVISDCVIGPPVDADELFRAVLSEFQSGGDFATRWLAASGLGDNPTKPS